MFSYYEYKNHTLMAVCINSRAREIEWHTHTHTPRVCLCVCLTIHKYEFAFCFFRLCRYVYVTVCFSQVFHVLNAQNVSGHSVCILWLGIRCALSYISYHTQYTTFFVVEVNLLLLLFSLSLSVSLYLCITYIPTVCMLQLLFKINYDKTVRVLTT